MARRIGAEQTAKLFAHATWSCSRTILGRGADRRHGAQDPKSKRRYAGPVRTPRFQRLARRSPRRPSSLPRDGLGHVQFFVDRHRNDGSSVLGIFRRWRDPRLGMMLDCPNADQLVRGIRMHLETRDLLPQNVDNQLTCTSCRPTAGTVADGSPSAMCRRLSRTTCACNPGHHVGGANQRLLHAVHEWEPPFSGIGGHEGDGGVLRVMKGQTKPEDKVACRGAGKIDPRSNRMSRTARTAARKCTRSSAACHGKKRQQTASVSRPPTALSPILRCAAISRQQRRRQRPADVP